MRKELYTALCNALMAVEGIKHVDLWNHNVEFIEQETAWARPAVFVEFAPISWKPVSPWNPNRQEYKGDTRVVLHIVTDWEGSASAESSFREDALAIFDWSEVLQPVVQELRGETFGMLRLVETQTNHNHEEIVENIEVYSVTAIRKINVQQ